MTGEQADRDAARVRVFRRQGQNPSPFTSTPALETGGPYRFTRNPMYPIVPEEAILEKKFDDADRDCCGRVRRRV